MVIYNQFRRLLPLVWLNMHSDYSSLPRNLVVQNRNMLQGKWQGATMESVFELKGMTMGIIGLGGIGSQVARRARAMDMKVIAVDIVPKYKEQLGDLCDEIKLVQEGQLIG